MDIPVDALPTALIDTTLALCAIPSEIGHERALCDHVEARLLRTLPRDAVIRHNDSLIALPGPRRADRPTVGLVGHLDTVPARQEVPVHCDGERIWGCGASDMKAGLAVMLELAERLDLEALGCNLTLVFYEAEEGDYLGNGLQPLLEGYEVLRDIDLAYCLEPSDNRLQVGCVGGLHATLTFRGARAHSARPWQGVNAVHKAGPLLAELDARGRVPVTFGGLTFYEVMSVTMVEGGGARNVVPDRFAMNVNYRFAPGKSAEQAKADLEALVAGRCEVAYTDVSPSGPVCLDNPLLAPVLARPGMVAEPKQAWTDVARLALFGIDAVNLGPGESAQAHQRNESCRVDLLADGYALFAEALTRL